MASFGERLKSLRESKGFTQDELAEKVGVTKQAISQYERVPLDSISRRLGHSDSKVTKQIYIHHTEKLQQLDDELISEAVLL